MEEAGSSERAGHDVRMCETGQVTYVSGAPVYSFQPSEDSYSRVAGNGYFKLCRLPTVSITPPSPSSSSLQSFKNVKTILGSWTV